MNRLLAALGGLSGVVIAYSTAFADISDGTSNTILLVQAVPEPASIAILSAGVAGLIAAKILRRNR